MSEYIVDGAEPNSTVLKSTTSNGYEHEKWLPVREEIVRCMDCAWFTNSSHYGAYCTNFGSPLHDDYDGFCAWGARKEVNNGN